MPVFRDYSQTKRTAENGLLSAFGIVSAAFLWRAHAQSGFKEGIRRMQCDHRPLSKLRNKRNGPYQLAMASDRAEAMNFLNREGKHANVPRPDLILLDLNLPKKDGREVLEEIKESPALKSIPVVILSTAPDGSYTHEGMSLHRMSTIPAQGRRDSGGDLLA